MTEFSLKQMLSRYMNAGRVLERTRITNESDRHFDVLHEQAGDKGSSQSS